MSSSTRQVELDFGVELSALSLEACLAKYSSAPDVSGACVHFNLRKTRFIDIDALLFILCVLSHLKRHGTPILLTLPEHDGLWTFDSVAAESDEEQTWKVRDFLVRWAFESALEQAVGDVRSILPPHQEDYFAAPLKYYREGSLHDPYFGGATRALSCNLIEITHMTRGPAGDKTVSQEEIDHFINDLALESRMMQALSVAAGHPGDLNFAKEFANNILKEALLNTYEHPQASMSMVAMARVPRPRRLVVAIADNGDNIPETIRQAFAQDERGASFLKSIILSAADREMLRRLHPHKSIDDVETAYRLDVAATLYATQEGTTRKADIPGVNRGLGLHYVKTRAFKFGGTCTIRTRYAFIVFGAEGPSSFVARPVAPWPGNLITVTFPLPNRE